MTRSTTSTTAAQDFTATPTPDGVVIDLPRRQLGPVRFIGLAFIAVGLFMIGFGVNWIRISMNSGGGGGAPADGAADAFDWFRFLFALFGFGPMLAGLGPIGVGLGVMFGRSSIELSRLRVRAVERAGPFWWSWKRPADGLRRFTVSGSAVAVND